MADSFQNYLAGFKAVTDAQQGSGENLGSLFLRGMERGQAMRLRKEQSAMDKERLEMDRERAKLDQALAPLKLDQALQDFKINVLKLDALQRAKDEEIQVRMEMDEIGEAAAKLFRAGAADPKNQADFYEKALKLKTLWTTEQGDPVIKGIQSRIAAAEDSKRSLDIQNAIANRLLAGVDFRTKGQIEIETIKQKNRVALAALESKLAQELAAVRGNVKRDAYISRNQSSVMEIWGATPDQAATILGEIWDKQIQPYQTRGATSPPSPTVSQEQAPAPATPVSPESPRPLTWEDFKRRRLGL